MVKVGDFIGWGIRHAPGIGYLLGLMTSASFFPALLALSAGATPVQYGIGAVSGLLAYVAGRAVWARTQLWREDTKARERLSSDSSPFDPMEKIYRDKRLFLKDLAPLGRREVKGRKFINCEIIGPGDIVIDMRSHESKPFPTMRENWFHDVNLIQIAPEQGKIVHNALFFPDCDFEGCDFYSLNALFTHRVKEELNWITARSAEEPMGLFRTEIAAESQAAIAAPDDVEEGEKNV